MPNPLSMSEADYLRWLETTPISIGGSSVGAIVGVDQYKSASDVWDGIMNFTPQQRRRGHMDRGNVMEPHIADIYAETTGRTVMIWPKKVHPQFSFLHGTCDRLIPLAAGREGSGVLEIKCPALNVFRQTRDNGVSQSYYAQLQHYLDVYDCSWGAFAIFNVEEWSLHQFDVERDDEWIREARDEVVRFWQDFVLTRQRPEQEDNIRRMSLTRAVGAEYVEVAHPQLETLMRQLRGAKEQKSIAEQQYKVIGEEIKAILFELGHEKVLVPGQGKLSFAETKTRTVDRDRLLAATLIDPDKLDNWLAVQGNEIGTVERWEQMLNDCKADLTEYVRETTSRSFVPYFSNRGR